MFTTFRILLFAKWLVNGVISNVFKRQFSTNLLYLLYVLMDIVFLHSPGNCQCLKWNFFCLLYFPLAKCLYCIGSNSKLCLTACIKIAIFDKYQNSFALWTSDSFRAYTWTSKVLLRLISYVEDADILSNILDWWSLNWSRSMRLELIKVNLPAMENAEKNIKQIKSDVITRNRKSETLLSSIRNP